jgi:hypothetical protein
VRRTVLMLGLLALAACGSPPEPEDGPSPEIEGPLVVDVSGGGTPSIRGLIGERQRLGLTGAQVTTLDSLAIRLASANDSLRASLRAEDGPRRGSEAWEHTRAALETIARNHRNAGLLVQSVLTDDQRRIACEMEAEDRARNPEPPRRMQPGAVRVGGRGGMQRDTIMDMAPRGWPWCPPPPARR